MKILIEDTVIFKTLKMKNEYYVQRVRDIYKLVEKILNRISNTFPNYTVHDINHSYNVLNHMGDILGDKVPDYNEIELSAMIYSALLHDIGMFVSDEEKYKIINGEMDTEEQKFMAIKECLKCEEIIAIQQFIRPIHGQRSKKYIDENYKNIITIEDSSDISYAEHIGLICESHEKNREWITEFLDDKTHVGEHICNFRFVAILLRLGDILDFDSQRAPKNIYKHLILDEHSKNEWMKHFELLNTKKANYTSGNELEITFEATCDDPNTYRKLLEYIRWVDNEIENSAFLVEEFKDSKYKLPLKRRVNNKVKTKGFTTSDLSMSVDYIAITDLLMSENLYRDKKVGLREIVQNAVDACNVRKEEWNDLLDTYKPIITIAYVNDKVIIQDNGVGMDENRIKHYFLNIGKSYYSSNEFKFKGLDYVPISRYGIGFLSAFMLSDKILVKSKYKGKKGIQIELLKDSQFVVWKETNEEKIGTEIIFEKGDFEEVFPTIDEVKNYMDKTFLLTTIEFIIKDCSDKKIFENTKINDEKLITENWEFCFDTSKYSFIKYRNSLEPPFKGRNLYLYNIETNTIDECNIDNFIDYIHDNIISVIDIEVISWDVAGKIQDYDNAVNDIDEAIEKFEDDFENISILLTGEQYKEIIGEKLRYFSGNDKIIGNYSYKQFCKQFEHEYEETRYTVYDYDIEAYNKDLIIFTTVSPKIKFNIYCRGVYIKSFSRGLARGLHFEIPNEINVNIKTDDIYPNVARDDIVINNTDKYNKIFIDLHKELLNWNIKKMKDGPLKELVCGYAGFCVK